MAFYLGVYLSSLKARMKMVQLLTTKYNEEEGRILMISNPLGVCMSVMVSVLIGYLIGLFSNLRSVVDSPTKWSVMWLKTGSIISPLSWVMTFGVCLLFLKKSNVKRWKQDVRRMIPGTLFLPLGITYAFVVMGLVIFPLFFLLVPYINPVFAMYVGLIAFLPFFALGAAMILPESPAGKALRRFVHRLKKSN
jgi:uncharacterized protein YacL